MGAADDLAVDMRLLPRHVPQQLHADHLGVLPAGKTARRLRVAHGQQGRLRRRHRAFYWIRKRLHRQFRCMHSRTERTDHVVRVSMGHRVRATVHSPQKNCADLV